MLNLWSYKLKNNNINTLYNILYTIYTHNLLLLNDSLLNYAHPFYCFFV
jgi:hypothetical protein